MSETVPALAPVSPRLRDCHLGSGEGARFVPRCHENSKVTTALVHRRLSHVVFDIAMLCRSSIRHEVPRGVKSCESDKAFERSRIVEEMEIAALVTASERSPDSLASSKHVNVRTTPPESDLDLCRFHAGRNDEDQTAWRETTKTLVGHKAAAVFSLALRLGDRRNGKMQDRLPSTKHPLNAGKKEKHILSHASLLSRLVPLSNVLLGGVLLGGSMPLSTGRSIRYQHLKRQKPSKWSIQDYALSVAHCDSQ
ncbi:hypothetical protein Q7P36_000840 [Cladosporium allicinum]